MMRSVLSRASRIRSGRRASALVEFTLCLPILIMLLAAAIEYGFMVYDSMLLLDAAREGARWAAKGMDDATVSARVAAYFPTRNLSNPTVTIKEYSSNDVEITSHQRIPGSQVRVTVSCSVQWMTPVEALMGGPTYGLAANAVFRVENP